MNQNSVPLALKYRPRKLADVAGQEVVVTTLTNAFNLRGLHHAYIFAGYLGSGKTTVARILAAMENCQSGPTMEPCGKCKNCVEIFAGNSLDIKEMDAASQRGVDDIRDLKKELFYSPMSCRNIYVILDEAHSLTAIAAESLLKAIEEPPKNVRFILCTTEPQALKDTIHSRCIYLSFQKINWYDITEHLRKVVAAESISIDDSALKFIAKKAKGSVRNALQNLQAVVDYAGTKPVTIEIAQKALNTIDETLYFQLIDAILAKEILNCYKVLNNVIINGRNANDIISGLEMHLRNLNCVVIAQSEAVSFGFTEDEIKRYQHQGNRAKPRFISEMLNLIVEEVAKPIFYNLDIQPHLEKWAIKSIMKLIQLEKEKAKIS